MLPNCDMRARTAGKGDDINALIILALLLVDSLQKTEMDFNLSKVLIGVDVFKTEKAMGTSKHGLVQNPRVSGLGVFRDSISGHICDLMSPVQRRNPSHQC